MKKTGAKKKTSIEEIEKRAVRGEDVSEYFDYKNAKMMPPVDNIERVKHDKSVQRVNVDFAQSMLTELDAICTDLNVPRQSLIKTMLRQAMDQYFSNKKLRKA